MQLWQLTFQKQRFGMSGMLHNQDASHGHVMGAARPQELT